MTKNEMAEFLSGRAEMYQFLGAAFLMEFDKNTITYLKAVFFPTDLDNKDLEESYKMLADAVSPLKDEDLDDLAADYAKVFLAAGSATGVSATPYESVYKDKHGSISARSEEEVLALYALHGWEPSTNMYRTMHDHAGLELQFMAALLLEQRMALYTDNEYRYQKLLEEEKAFMNDHLGWILGLCLDVFRYADTAFYRAISKLTENFLKQEKEILSMGGEAWVIE